MADTVYLDSLEDSEVLLSKLSQPVRDWFKDKFPDFTDPQKMAIPSIVDGEHLLYVHLQVRERLSQPSSQLSISWFDLRWMGTWRNKYTVFTSRPLRR